MINVIEFPQRRVNDDPAQLSKWSAVHQPIIFKMERRDFEITSVGFDHDNNTKLNYSGLLSGLTVGDTIFVNAARVIGLYVVLSISPTFIIIDYQFTGLTGTGYFNFTDRLNYFVRTRIYGVSNTNSYILLGVSINKPDAFGNVKVDVSSLLKTLVGYNDTFQYDQLNKFDDSQGGRFNIQYQENWDGHEGSYSAISNTLLYYYVNSAQQVQSKYGSNMGEYVPFNNANESEPKAKFMSDFESPTYFPGYPFSLSFIFSDAIVGFEIKKFETKLNINKADPNTNSYTLSLYDILEVNRLTLEEDYDEGISFLNVWLEAGEEACRQYVAEDYVAEDYFEEECGLIEIEDTDEIIIVP